jgi:acetylornithine aminotransferase
VAEQARTLVHTSNLYFTLPQRDLAAELSRRTFGGRVFLSNSGAEANECALKLARRYGVRRPGPEGPRHEIVVFEQSFHGRTFGAISATAQEKYQKDFGPLLPGFAAAEFGNLDSVRALLTPRTCAVLIEPIQGEGGVRVASPAFFGALAALCRERDLLLMLDEVQTGMGRTGSLFAWQNPSLMSGVVPDVLIAAKALANGLPIGATIARPDAADLLQPGDHASTFGGGPVPCRAALAVLAALDEARLARVRALGDLFFGEINSWRKTMPFIRDVRGAGLMIGIELDRPGAPVVARAREAGLLVNCTADRVIRLLPPFVLTDPEARKGLAVLQGALAG